MCKNMADMVQTRSDAPTQHRLPFAALSWDSHAHRRPSIKSFFLFLTFFSLTLDSLAQLLITSPATFPLCASLTVYNLAACNYTTNRDPQHSVCKKTPAPSAPDISICVCVSQRHELRSRIRILTSPSTATCPSRHHPTPSTPPRPVCPQPHPTPPRYHS
jgi:hypothetical protein